MVCVFLVLLGISEREDNFHTVIKNIKLHDTPSNNAMIIWKYLGDGSFVLRMGHGEHLKEPIFLSVCSAAF